MDYEKYNNALEKAKVRYNEIKGTDCSEEKFLLDLFPELKESEGERVRKWLIKYFNKADFNGMLEYVNGIKSEDILAWLEKQGKQKPSWSEEDEEFYNDIIKYFSDLGSSLSNDEDDVINWLKSLKERLS